jgi:uncharacterized protein YjbI with pentapeptide repeats
MSPQTIEKTQLVSSECYQMVKDEHLHSVIVSSQVLAGSRILLSTYRQLVFSDCIFYACDFQGVIFENCVFENCRFEFTHIRKCQFINCNFTDCNFMASTSINSGYMDCDLCISLQELVARGKNNIQFSKSDDHSTDIYIKLSVA